jgi:hypothetical protein
MEAKTYNDYYNILLEGCKEAFKAIELKEFLYTDEAMEDNKEYSVSKESIKQLGIDTSNNLIVNYQIERDIKTDFIRFLDRQQQLFEKKHLIPRNDFYKKCLNSLNIKLTELNKQEYRILRGISDMGIPPDPLLFLEYMKREIKLRSLVCNDLPEPQQNNEIEIYLKSYKHNYFSSVIDKRDKENKENSLFYGKVIASILQQRNNELLLSEILKEKYNLLSTYNRYLHFLTGHTMQLFKAVNDYLNTANNGYLTKIKINEDEVFNSLKNVKEITKNIKHNLLNEEIKTASKIRDYCILMFDDCIDLLKDSFGIDICNSPLKTHFENVKTALESSINFDELKIRKDLETNTADTPQQPPKSENLYIPKPYFKPESIEEVMTTLKIFFDASQHTELKRLIETGGIANEKLLFRGNGNKLSDYFKRLYENQNITGCDKKDLINWIVKNFKNIYRKTEKDFVFRTVEKTISGTEQPCKNPII